MLSVFLDESWAQRKRNISVLGKNYIDFLFTIASNFEGTTKFKN